VKPPRDASDEPANYPEYIALVESLLFGLSAALDRGPLPDGLNSA